MPQNHSQGFSEKFLWIKVTGFGVWVFFLVFAYSRNFRIDVKKYALWLYNTGIRYSRFPKHSYHGSLLLLNLTEQYSKENSFGKNVKRLPPYVVQEAHQFSSVESLIPVRLFATPWTAVCQASLSITNPWNLLKIISIESVIPSNHLILCHPLLL